MTTERNRPIYWARAAGIVLLGPLAVVSVTALGGVNPDARLLVLAFTSVGLIAAVSAIVLAHQGRRRAAGIAFLLSAATPTYFAYPLSLAALIIGLVLLIRRGRRPNPPVSPTGPAA